MRVPLKGLNSRRKRLADGTIKTYYYAWKGGPPIRGKPGSPEFVASYNEAVSRKITPPPGVLLSILQGYQASEDFLGLSPRTRSDYASKIRLIEAEFGDFPLAALKDVRSRGVFLKWRDRLAHTSLRQADYSWSVLSHVLAWALNRGLVATNPCTKGGRLYHGSRADKVWSENDEANFLEKAPHHLHLALKLGLWTGQREGDLLRLQWASYDGARITLRQSKTGVHVTIPVGASLKAALDSTPKPSLFILSNLKGKPWTDNSFRSSWAKACRLAGVAGVTFNDLRGTAVTRLALSGCTEAEIASITGHSLRDVRSILDSHYLHRDPALAESAIKKLEARTKTPDQAPDCA
jgi:integrase